MAATYLGRDDATLGDWVGTYGSLGYWIQGLAQVLPGGASADIIGADTYTWGDTSTDPRSLRAPDGSPRNQTVWYAATSFAIDLTLTAPCVLSAYIGASDLSGQSYASTFQVREGGSLLDAQILNTTDTAAGTYVRWMLDEGSYEIAVLNGADSSNAILNGLFFDAPSQDETGTGGAGIGGAAGVSASTAPPSAGGVGLGGVSAVSASLVSRGIGGVGLGGTSPISSSLVARVSGGIAAGGRALAQAVLRWLSRGGVGVGGSAVVAYSPADDPRTIRQAVLSRLRAASALTAVVGSRISAQAIPQTSSLPAVTTTIVSSEAGHHLGGSDGTITATVRIDCWDRARDQAGIQGQVDAMAESARLRLDGFRGRIGQVEILSCLLDSGPYDLSEPPAHANDAWTYRVTSEYIIKYRVNKPDQLEG